MIEGMRNGRNRGKTKDERLIQGQSHQVKAWNKTFIAFKDSLENSFQRLPKEDMHGAGVLLLGQQRVSLLCTCI